MSREVIKSRKSSRNAKAHAFLYKIDPCLSVKATETSDFQKRNRLGSEKKEKEKNSSWISQISQQLAKN